LTHLQPCIQPHNASTIKPLTISTFKQLSHLYIRMVGISKAFKKELTEAQRASIWGMHVAGWSGRRIAGQLGLSNSTVADTI
jgi:hypothetical protein